MKKISKFNNNNLGKMAKEDMLQVEMGKLEIEPIKPNITTKDNPFNHQSTERCVLSRNSTQCFKCPCMWPKRNVNSTMFKKKSNKILKEPVLRLLQSTVPNEKEKKEFQQSPRAKYTLQPLNSDVLSLCALVDNCNQLRISSHVKKIETTTTTKERSHTKWWENNVSRDTTVRKSVIETNQAGSCSQQALNPPCDVTIDELASYFETLVHIPKKMSSMAEMMYI